MAATDAFDVDWEATPTAGFFPRACDWSELGEVEEREGKEEKEEDDEDDDLSGVSVAIPKRPFNLEYHPFKKSMT